MPGRLLPLAYSMSNLCLEKNAKQEDGDWGLILPARLDEQMRDG